MQKDYVKPMPGAIAIDETDFVEAYWTHMWHDHDLKDMVAADIGRREEFKLMDPYVRQLSPGARVLDGGCGLGEWSMYYASRGFDVVGMDISRATIQRLNEKFPQQNFMAGDVRDTGFEDSSFDAYFSWGVFEHFECGMASCFEEAYRILKPGAYLFITVPFHNERHWRRDKRAQNICSSGAIGEDHCSPVRFYQWRLTGHELQKEFKMNGFEVLQIKPINKAHGVWRAVKHDLGINPDTLFHKIVRRLITPFVPANHVAHMVMGIGKKI